jgi:FkbM family methyltransferase
MIKKIIKKLIPNRYYSSVIEWKNLIFDVYATKSYSQEGEDMILRRIFEEKRRVGFYVDVGAHHPKRFSNTWYFYKKGWRGINIDAMPGSMKLFKKMRARDINLEIAISDKKQVLTYYCFNDPALNGFSKALSAERDGKGRYRIIDEIKMKTSTLAEVLDTYLPKGIEIDFLSVDVEGLDFQVLKSNNWSKYKPKVILVESLNSSLSNLGDCEVCEFLISKDYYLFAKAVNTLFFLLHGDLI